MTDMVQNLLMLARSKKSDQKVEMEQIHIAVLVKKVITELEASARTKNIALSIEGDYSDITVNGNSKLLEQAIFNVIQNAIMYTEKGSVLIAVTSIHQQVKITVTDTGIGIAKNNISHVFEPFYKADSARTISTGGVGLGLSIVKEIVQIHRGVISIQSELGKGTTVNVILPTSNAKSS
jgi:signal transduction histidine kinase